MFIIHSLEGCCLRIACFLLCCWGALVVSEAIAIVFKADNIFDTLNLTLVEYGSLVELVWVCFSASNLFENFCYSGDNQHLISCQNCLETLRKRAKIEEKMVLNIESLYRFRLRRIWVGFWLSWNINWRGGLIVYTTSLCWNMAHHF